MQSMRIGRRQAARLAGGTAAALFAPAVLRAQSGPVRIGLIHPVTGALAYSGQQCRVGNMMAIEEVNAAGGIKSLGGARIEPLLGDAQSRPEVAVSEVDKMAEAGVHAFVGAFASAIGLAATQAAAKYNIPWSIDSGVSDLLVTRGLKNVFRFTPGYGSITTRSVEALDAINKKAGSPAKSAILVHEESEFGSGTAKLLAERLPGIGIEVKEVIRHANPTRDFTNVALRIKSAHPDLVIITNYQNEYVLLARTLVQQRVELLGTYSVMGGGFNLRLVKEQPQVAAYMMDFNIWMNSKSPRAAAFRKRVEDAGNTLTFEVPVGYLAVRLLADAFERAASTDRDKVIAALETSTYFDAMMPFEPTKFVNGQNQGARAVLLQVLDNDIVSVWPDQFAAKPPVFPRPKG
ncbi:MAG: ABC transporter substrate-binding protein [Acetobacteraceae bacterium]|nr:ABC transporter substrate-binding protein [Acetobacteraceae bacterium]